MFEMATEEGLKTGVAKIKVVGIGGGGCNAVNTMIKNGLAGVEYVVANTDAQALDANLAPTKVQLGVEITKGLGAGANPEVGRKAALEEYEKLTEILEGSDLVFITAGMGGGTGTGAAPVIAKLCKELGALTVGVVTKPFLFEGKKRMRQAISGISVLEEGVDSLITIPNQRLLQLAGESLSLVDTFKTADNVLLNAVQGISDLINNTGLVNADFADVTTVMSNKGLALMGTGICSGPDRAVKAATEAISSPLLEDITIDGATGIIINITGDPTLTTHETNEAMTLIMEAADEDAEIIFGTVIDDSLEDEVKVTVIATGLNCTERVEAGKKIRSEMQHASSSPSPTTSQRRESEPTHDAHEMRERRESRDPSEERMAAPRYNPQHEETPTAQGLEAPYSSNGVQEAYESATEYAAMSSKSLADNIQEAAGRFSSNETTSQAPKTETREVESPSNSSGSWEHQTQASEASRKDEVYKSSRAKSIAEKLGFLDFEEETLDMPTYLRREKGSGPEL